MAELTFPEFIEAIQNSTTAVATADQHLAIAEQMIEAAEEAIATAEQARTLVMDEADGFVLDVVANAWNEAHSRIDDLASQLEEAVEACRDGLGQVSQVLLALDQTMVKNLGELGQEFRAFQGDVRAFLTFLEQEERELVQASDRFSRESDRLEDAVEAFAAELKEGMDRFRTEVEQRHQQTLDRVSRVLLDHVAQKEPDLMERGFDTFRDLGERSYRSFEDESRALGDELQQRLEQIMEEVGRHVETTLKREVEDRFEELIEDAMDALIKEVAECLVQMGIGAQISGAISPAIPLIVAAQKAAMVLRMGVKAIDAIF